MMFKSYATPSLEICKHYLCRCSFIFKISLLITTFDVISQPIFRELDLDESTLSVQIPLIGDQRFLLTQAHKKKHEMKKNTQELHGPGYQLRISFMRATNRRIHYEEE